MEIIKFELDRNNTFTTITLLHFKSIINEVKNLKIYKNKKQSINYIIIKIYINKLVI